MLKRITKKPLKEVREAAERLPSTEIALTDLEIENIDPNTVKSFTYYFKNSDIYSKYYLKINQKNVI